MSGQSIKETNPTDNERNIEMNTETQAIKYYAPIQVDAGMDAGRRELAELHNRMAALLDLCVEDMDDTLLLSDREADELRVLAGRHLVPLVERLESMLER